jgi:hypothetical protein
MKWKLTGRYMTFIVIVVMLVIFVNIAIGTILLLKQVPAEETSPEQFTRQFQKELLVSGRDVTVTKAGTAAIQKSRHGCRCWMKTGRNYTA